MTALDDIAQQLEQAGVPHPSQLAELHVPAVRIIPEPTTIDRIRTGESRLGGMPDLPVGFAWPTRQGRPLSFIAQLDLAAARLPDLPSAGWLVVFYDCREQPWGFDPMDADGSRVHFIPADTVLERATPPAGLDATEQFGPCRCVFSAVVQLPSLGDPLGSASWEPMLDQDREEEYSAIVQQIAGAADDVPYHQLGGYPWQIQGDMRSECQLVDAGIYCGAPLPWYRFCTRLRQWLLLRDVDRRWRLLLQIDTDDVPGWMWGDCGRLYFWIRPQDLAARAFDRVRVILQCA